MLPVGSGHATRHGDDPRIKLLFDQNVSRSLTWRLADLCPDATHVAFLSMLSTPDERIRAYARTNGSIVVTKDRDFAERRDEDGTPPKVIWLRTQNCTTAVVEATLRRHWQDIEAFAASENVSILMLY